MMWIAVALATWLSAFVACLAVVRVTRSRPYALDATIAAGLLVCGEALVVHALSPLHAVGRAGLLAGNVLLIACASALAWSRRARLRLRPRLPRIRHVTTIVVLLLGAMILVSAIAYRPNNWDSMTYHLARVAHWLQRGSVAAYPTNVSRQVLYPPGTEYLITVLQGISGTDRLAGLVQLAAWALIAAAAAPLARCFGTPRRLAPFAAVLVAAGPLAVQEASSTQNDLVAGVLAIAAVASALPFVHARGTWRARDLALTIVVITGGLLTKPSSVVVATPFLLWGAVRAAGTLRRRDAWRRMALALPALVIAAAAIGPYERARAAAPPDPSVFEPYVYLHPGELGDRALNVVRGVFRNIPLPLPMVDRLAPEQTVGCKAPRTLCVSENLQLREDYTANIGQAIIVLAAMAFGLTRARRLPGTARAGLLCLALAWVLFQAVFRDNVWAPRLHLAYFALAPAALGAFRMSVDGRRVQHATALVLTAALAVHAGFAAARTARRPLRTRALRTAGAEASYYREGPSGVAAQHEDALATLAARGCRRLGLFIGGDSYDYPLTWRAMERGVEVRHVVRPDGWPCAVFSDKGVPPGEERRWAAVGAFVYVPRQPF